jgi:hypothetical protein
MCVLAFSPYPYRRANTFIQRFEPIVQAQLIKKINLKYLDLSRIQVSNLAAMCRWSYNFNGERKVSHNKNGLRYYSGHSSFVSVGLVIPGPDR